MVRAEPSEPKGKMAQEPTVEVEIAQDFLALFDLYGLPMNTLPGWKWSDAAREKLRRFHNLRKFVDEENLLFFEERDFLNRPRADVVVAATKLVQKLEEDEVPYWIERTKDESPVPPTIHGTKAWEMVKWFRDVARRGYSENDVPIGCDPRRCADCGGLKQ